MSQVLVKVFGSLRPCFRDRVGATAVAAVLPFVHLLLQP